MARKGVLTIGERCCIWLLMVGGVLPFQYVVSTNRFVQSTFYYRGCIVGTVLYAMLGPWLYWISVTRILHPDSQLNQYMIVVQFFCMYVVILTSRLKTLSNRERLCQLLNALLALREQVLQGPAKATTTFQQGLARSLLTKLIVFDLGMMVLSAAFFRTFIELKQSLIYSILGVCNLLQVSSMNIAVNLLMFVMYSGTTIYVRINAHCNDLVYGSKAPNEIVRLYLMHTEASLVVQSIVEVISIPILLLSVWYFFIIVFSIFYTYTSLVQDLEAGSTNALRNIINPLAFFISEVGQVYFMVSSSATFSRHARQIIPCLSMYTGRITDVPGDRAIELLTIEYLNRDYAIRIKGLFTIDNTMLFGIVASTTSYMIILVQYYLQE
ncbi:putative gustatory receptor 28a isoform X2 [Anopheles merus]|uniref:Gustatory receptor n=1 Tax=Anopheles merus TaxID=30066 RepID=A0A9I3MJK1_ANOME|nr:putative gustatory receptor 28a isoform X2 [Anopheles merus]